MPRAKATTTNAPVATTALGKKLQDEFADFPDIALLERRLEHPDDPGSTPIFLKDDPQPSCDEIQHFAKAKGKGVCPICRVAFRRWKVRSINSAMPNRLHGVIHNKRYIKVRKDELADPDQIADLVQNGLDEFARRGEGGKIVLVKMPFMAYAAIKLRELDARMRRDRNPQKMKSDLADAAGSALGDEAGETISKMQAEFSRPSSTIQDELNRD